MTVTINYDYSDFIEEIEEELEEENLSLSDTIQVLRDSKTPNSDYYPVIDWYYTDEQMQSLFLKDEEDTKEDIAEKLEMKKQYLSDKGKLKSITAEEFLKELKKHP